jgi:hypothetical protein
MQVKDYILYEKVTTLTAGIHHHHKLGNFVAANPRAQDTSLPPIASKK